MGAELVETASDDSRGGGGRSSPLSYTGIFEEECPRYMAWGMTLDEFWEGDPARAVYYRRKHDAQTREANEMAWLNGYYMYSALGAMFPLYNALCSRHEAYPYLEAPLPLTQEEADEREKEAKRKAIENAREQMMITMTQFNRQFRQSHGGGGDVTDERDTVPVLQHGS